MPTKRYSKTLACFANSRKTGGRCVAGKELRNGSPADWVRPISDRPTHELSITECCYENRQVPELLDIVEIEFKHHQPVAHQIENHCIDADYYWEKQGRLSWDDLDQWLDNPKTLWTTGESSYSGHNNRVAVNKADGSSLLLIAVDSLDLIVGRKAPEYPDSRRAVRCCFHYSNQYYLIDVTDPNIEQSYLAKSDGVYVIDDAVLCVSLGDEYQGYYYKLVAGVLFEGRF
jgi:hypothetical protein